MMMMMNSPSVFFMNFMLIYNKTYRVISAETFVSVYTIKKFVAGFSVQFEKANIILEYVSLYTGVVSIEEFRNTPESKLLSFNLRHALAESKVPVNEFKRLFIKGHQSSMFFKHLKLEGLSITKAHEAFNIIQELGYNKPIKSLLLERGQQIW